MHKFRATRHHNGKLTIHFDPCAQYEHIVANFEKAAVKWGGLVSVGESINGAEWVRRIRERDPDCLNSADCIDAIQSMMATNPDTVPVALTLRRPEQHWWQRFFAIN